MGYWSVCEWHLTLTLRSHCKQHVLYCMSLSVIYTMKRYDAWSAWHLSPSQIWCPARWCLYYSTQYLGNTSNPQQGLFVKALHFCATSVSQRSLRVALLLALIGVMFLHSTTRDLLSGEITVLTVDQLSGPFSFLSDFLLTATWMGLCFFFPINCVNN